MARKPVSTDWLDDSAKSQSASLSKAKEFIESDVDDVRPDTSKDYLGAVHLGENPDIEAHGGRSTSELAVEAADVALDQQSELGDQQTFESTSETGERAAPSASAAAEEEGATKTDIYGERSQPLSYVAPEAESAREASTTDAMQSEQSHAAAFGTGSEAEMGSISDREYVDTSSEETTVSSVGGAGGGSEPEGLLLAPTLVVANHSGLESGAIPIDIQVFSNSQNIEETIYLSIMGVPDSASFSSGVDNGDGSWTFATEDLSDLLFYPPMGENDYDLEINAVAIDPWDNSAETAANFSISVDPAGDVIIGTSGKDTLYGTQWSDEIYGLGGADKIYGGEGYDVIYGGEGSDKLYGEEGEDVLYGGAGKDVLEGGEDADILHGGEGADKLYGDEGEDVLYGDEGKDTLRGGEGSDILHGGEDADKLFGEEGEDVLYGDEGKDTLRGGEGSDILHGGEGADKLYGDEGSDILRGGAGEDILRGGAGDDVLIGGEGDDVLRGDAGNDLFIFGVGSGQDSVDGGAGGWLDAIRLENISQPPSGEFEGPGSWVIETDDNYTIDYDNGTLVFDDDNASGSVTLADGSELEFQNISYIEWENSD